MTPKGRLSIFQFGLPTFELCLGHVPAFTGAYPFFDKASCLLASIGSTFIHKVG